MTIESRKWLKLRIATLLGLFVVLFIALASRAFQLQILSGEALRDRAGRQHTQTLVLQPERGIIYDRLGEKLAATLMVDSVFADPTRVIRPRETAKQLAAVLGADAKAVEKRIMSGKHFCWVARRISWDQGRRIEALNLEGVHLIREPKRFYPNGELASHLLGFVGLDSVGLEGLEKKYDNHLKGTPEKLVWTRDAKGKRLYPRVEHPVARQEEPSNLILTIDSRLQHLVETQLREAVRLKEAKGGIAVVMDPQTGEILAMANAPGFDPNTLLSPDKGRNRIVTDCFDPGSTFKPFLAAAALEAGAVRETDRFHCENGTYVVADRTFHEANRKRYGTLTFPEILKYSSNIGCVKIAEKLGKERFHDYITRFGFGSRTGIDLPGESPGLLRPVRNWTRVDASTIAFGQGVSVTAIQLATALSAIANRGVLMKPYVVRAIVDRQGEAIRRFSPSVVRRVVSPETAGRLSAILTDVVEAADGTGKNARIVNVAVAGKTGTAQKFDFSRRAYSSERVRTSFMGFFPANAPRFVILVSLDEPQRDKWGGVAAAPVFRNIGEQILNCIQTHIRRTPAFPHEGFPESQVRVRLVSASPVSLPGQGDCRIETDGASMPDFRGMTIREALKQANTRGIALTVAGSGWAVQQDPRPGVPLSEGTGCAVTFSQNR